MLSRVFYLAILVALGLVEATIIGSPHMFAPGSLIARQNRGGKGNAGQNRAGGNGGNNNNGGGGGGGGACLAANVKQTASNTDGQETGTEGIKAGQAKSLKDPNNFINFCAGKTITNGKQLKQGSCNPTPMGQIPAQAKMISSMVLNPKTGDKLPAGQTFKVDLQVNNLQAGSFTNPTTTYYTAPQTLNGNGQIIGHAHVTIQNIGSLNSQNPPDPTQFAFFKGIDDAGNGQGRLSATVDGGLPAGVYRVCTILSASNHQPVAMPIAQRGAQDDCTKFEVTGGGGGGGNGGNKAAAGNKGAAAGGNKAAGAGGNKAAAGGNKGGNRGRSI